MENIETKSELVKAIISVMQEVAGIEKSMTVGTGSSSYKGVSDKDVKKIIGQAMAKHGLCIVPIDIQSTSRVDRWEEVDAYSKETPKAMKTKQSVFTEVTAKYLLMHESGESQTISGYGHGVDAQDKGAGKATTYALKNALLYSFMIPTGDIEDTDKTHSETIAVPPAKKADIPMALPFLKPENKAWKATAQRLADGLSINEVTKYFQLTPDHAQQLMAEAMELTPTTV